MYLKSKCKDVFMWENWHTVFLIYAVDRHRLIDGERERERREKTICNWPHTVNKNTRKDANEWQSTCLFTVLTYHRLLCYIYTSARSKEIISYVLLSVNSLVFFSLVFFSYSFKASTSRKKNLFEENERERCMFEADGQMMMKEKKKKDR